MSVGELGWRFAPLHGGERKGINDAGIESFHRSERLGRETCQNIQDARREDNDDPARAELEYIKVAREALPGLKRLSEIFEACREYMLAPAKGQENAEREAGRDFFDRAQEVLTMSQIPVLRIGDYNTRGVVGDDDDDNSPWCRLVRSQGRARSEGVGGGTFGIGQRAPFAFSDVRCVFYSTMLPDGQVRFMGKAILSSFRDPASGEFRQNVGYFGERATRSEDVVSVTENERIPEVFRRKEPGTDLYIIGFSQQDWHVQTRRSILLNFFGAIGHNRLSVRIYGSGHEDVTIDASTLDDQFEELKKHGSKEEQREITAASFYHRALIDPLHAQPYEREIPGLGICKLYIHRDGRAPQRIAYMRSPRILVYSQGSRRLSGYAAVFLCDTDEGNRLLGALEDPNHASWHQDQASRYDKTLRKRGAAALKEIRRFVTETLDSLVAGSGHSKEDFPELAQYLPLDEAGEQKQVAGVPETTDQAQTEETPQKTGTHEEWKDSVRTRPPRAPVSGHDKGDGSAGADEGASGGGGEHGGDGGQEGGHGPDGAGGSGPGGGAEPAPYVLGPRDLRFRAWAESDKGWYRIVLHPQQDCIGDMPVRAVGETGLFDVELLEGYDLATGESLDLRGTTIHGVSLVRSEKRTLRVRLSEGMRVSLTVGA